ncbi:MAG: AmmeMemoRadiSam system protein B, partial [Thermoplasmata archaeon]|nr:AmmeMemoRadiSam system protein B [Thermoplasmata archaeon]
AERAALEGVVQKCFEGPRGPGPLGRRTPTAPRRTRAVVVPHAGYVYSGPIAARAYAAVAREVPPMEVLLLGVDHTGNGRAFGLSRRPWRTPLGDVEVATELVDRIAGGEIVVDERAHADEHSLEVQLPFLQTVLPGVPIAALTVRFAPMDQLRAVASQVAHAVQGRDTLLIASTDFSHYVPPETARRLDALALAEIERRDGPGLYRTVVERDISMCGVAPTTVMLEALRDEPLTVRLLGWSHSGEAEPMSRVVGYAAAAFETAAASRSDRP